MYADAQAFMCKKDIFRKNRAPSLRVKIKTNRDITNNQYQAYP